MRYGNDFINLLFKFGTAILFAVSIFSNTTDLIKQLNALSLFKILYSSVFLTAVLKIDTSCKSDRGVFTLIVVLLHLTIPLIMDSQQNNSHMNLIVTHLIGTFGSTLSLVSLLDLGKSFYILPVKTKIKSNGLYSIIRHPIYLGYTLIAFSRLLASPCISNLILFFSFCALTVLRIGKEESLLLSDVEYKNYAKNVRFKIIPWIY